MSNRYLKTLSLIKYINILVFILFTVFLNTKIHILFYLIYIFTSFIISFIYYKNGLIKFLKNEIIMLIAVMLLIFISLIFGDHGIYNTLASFMFLFISYYDFSCMDKEIKKDSKIVSILDTVFYYSIVLLIIADMIYHFAINPGINNYAFLNLGDKNYSAVVIFLFFIYSFKNKYYLGISLSIILFFLFKSRLIYLSVIIFLILELVIKYINYKNHKRVINFVKDRKDILTYLSFALSVLGIIILSALWALLPSSSIKEYKQSFNDSSNAMRVRSNLYAIKEVVENHKLIYSGYDKDILRMLNLEENSETTEFMGYRLVQPHNFFLNIVLRFGLLLAVFYVIILSKIISKNLNKENLPIFASYLFMNLFMHSLILYPILILFLYVFTTKYPKDNIVKEYILEDE